MDGAGTGEVAPVTSKPGGPALLEKGEQKKNYTGGWWGNSSASLKKAKKRQRRGGGVYPCFLPLIPLDQFQSNSGANAVIADTSRCLASRLPPTGLRRSGPEGHSAAAAFRGLKAPCSLRKSYLLNWTYRRPVYRRKPPPGSAVTWRGMGRFIPASVAESTVNKSCAPTSVTMNLSPPMKPTP